MSITTTTTSKWIPGPVLRFYASFPLVLLPNEFEEEKLQGRERSGEGDVPVLWVHPPTPSSSSSPFPWATPNPTSLRYQLLFLLRASSTTREKRRRVRFREWENVDAAPGGVLPALHLPGSSPSPGAAKSDEENYDGYEMDESNEKVSSGKDTIRGSRSGSGTGRERLLACSEIRSWLDREWPLEEEVRALNGLPTQEAHTSALAYSHLILGKVYPAYMSATTPSPTQIHLPFPFNSPGGPSPLTLSTTVYNALPTFVRDLAGGETKRRFDQKRIQKEGLEGIRAVGGIVRDKLGEEGWMLGARSPSPLDALIASQFHVLDNLTESDPLRIAYEEEHDLREYVARVMQYAYGRV